MGPSSYPGVHPGVALGPAGSESTVPWMITGVRTASFSDDTLKKEKQAAYTADTCLVSDANGERKSEHCPSDFDLSASPLFIFRDLAAQTVAAGPAVWAPPRIVLEMQRAGPSPNPLS